VLFNKSFSGTAEGAAIRALGGKPLWSGGDVTNNKRAFVVFYGLIFASAVIWLSLAASMS